MIIFFYNVIERSKFRPADDICEKNKILDEETGSVEGLHNILANFYCMYLSNSNYLANICLWQTKKKTSHATIEYCDE